MKTFEQILIDFFAYTADVLSVIAANLLAIEFATALLEKFGGDSLTETKRNHASYLQQIQGF